MMLLVLLLVLCSSVLYPETIDDGIMLMVTKVSPTQYHLQWQDTQRAECWTLYQVWASRDPRTLGHVVATVRDTHIDLIESEPQTLWYFQIVRPGDQH